MKRLFDLSTSLIAIIFLIPFWLLISLLIKLTSKGPIFFRQERIGQNEIPFKIFKFRTMIVDAEKKGLQLTVGESDPRITPIGLYLRKYKLDELPQLFNIFLGDMSFVGPRPEVYKYVKLYNPEQKKVLQVKPGLTDLASIAYSNENEILAQEKNPEQAYIEKIMPAKLALNLQYIKESNLSYDIKLILKTLRKIVS